MHLELGQKTTLYVLTTYMGFEHFYQLLGGWQKIQELNDHQLNITVDFSKCEFIGHNGVAFLGGLVNEIKSRGGEVKFNWESLTDKIRMNLAQNGFLFNFGCNRDPWEGNSIPYRQDLHYDETEIGNYLQYNWLGKDWVNISPGLRQSISCTVSELYTNAFEHACCKTGVFSCGQHYPKKGTLEITIIDFGIGIPTSVRSLPQNLSKSAEDAVIWAFQSGNTTRTGNVCGGMGLKTLQDFVIKNHGTLTMFTNDVYAKIDDNGSTYEVKPINFSGTLVNIVLKCDESYYCLASEVNQPQMDWF